jgi:exosortase
MPMKIVVSKISVTILDLMGIPYIHRGFEIELATGSMTIDNPCSGLRSLISFFAMAFIFAYLRKFEKWRTVVLFTAAIPVALFCNILRVQFLLLVAFYWGIVRTHPGTPAHDYSGWVMFGLGMGIFFLIFDKLSK